MPLRILGLSIHPASPKIHFKFCCLLMVLHWFEMKNLDGHFRHILLYYFRKVKNTVQARKKLYDVYGEKSLTERQCQNWFTRFRSGDFHLKNAPRSGRPTKVDDDKIKAMIVNNRRSTTQEIAKKLNRSIFIANQNGQWKMGCLR